MPKRRGRKTTENRSDAPAAIVLGVTAATRKGTPILTRWTVSGAVPTFETRTTRVLVRPIRTRPKPRLLGATRISGTGGGGGGGGAGGAVPSRSSAAATSIRGVTTPFRASSRGAPLA